MIPSSLFAGAMMFHFLDHGLGTADLASNPQVSQKYLEARSEKSVGQWQINGETCRLRIHEIWEP